MKVLVYCPLFPTAPAIDPACWASIQALEWDGELTIVLGRADHKILTMDAAYDEITAKYNEAREMVLACGYDALFTVEADMILPPMALMRLTRTRADVAYGLYVSRRAFHAWLVATYIDKTSARFLSAQPDVARGAWGQVVESKGVGMGCTLIQRRVLEALPFHREPGMGANDWFLACDCQERGFTQKTDLGTVCGHISEEGVYWPDLQAEKLYRVEK